MQTTGVRAVLFLALLVAGLALVLVRQQAEGQAIAAVPTPPAPSALPPPAPLPAGMQPLAPGAWLLRGDYAPPRQPDGNSLVFAGPEGLLVVDSGRHPAHAAALVEFARGQGQPVAVLLNSHWHLDHVGGNPALRAAFPGLQVLATPAIDGALSGFLADYATQLRDALSRPGDDAARADWQAELARIEAGAALRPDLAIGNGGPRTLAGRDVVLGLETDAVTAGDLWLFDPASGVLAAGDLVTLPAPFLDTACPRRWLAALEHLQASPWTQLVPGHGPPLTRPEFTRYQHAFAGLLDCADSPAADAACVDGWLSDAGPLLPDDTTRQQARDLLGYYLAAVLRGPQARRHCGDAREGPEAPAPAA